MKKIIIILSIFTLAIMPVGGALADDKDQDDLRAEIDNMASKTLQRLYKQSPSSKGPSRRLMATQSLTISGLKYSS
jgi:hypothetical protein